MLGEPQWNKTAKSFHWIVALLIAVVATLGWTANLVAISPGKLQLFVWHKSVGLTVLAFMVLRLIWRFLSLTPAELEKLGKTNTRLAQLGHWALYIIAIAMPLSGWVMNSAANYPFQWFGMFSVPMLIGADGTIQAKASITHLVLFRVLTTLIVGHAGMAFKHQLSGLSILQRMLPGNWTALSTIAALLIAGISWVVLAWNNSYDYSQRSGSAVLNSGTTVEIATTAIGSNAPWSMVAQESSLGFIASYAGVEFEGVFTSFDPTIVFNPENPNAGYFDVAVDMTQATTNSSDRDSMLPGEDWFSVDMYPSAHYVANQFQAHKPARIKLLEHWKLKR